MPSRTILPRTFLSLLLLPSLLACPSARTIGAAPAVRWLRPADAKPSGSAPGAHSVLLARHPDGSQDFALVLAAGDEVWSGLTAFAREEHVVAARFTAIGAVRDPEVGWFDPEPRRYRALRLPEQGEVLSLVGDMGMSAQGAPVVHAHLVFGRRDGSTWGGHLLNATVSPTLEVFITTFPHRLDKQVDPRTELQIFDLASVPKP